MWRTIFLSIWVSCTGCGVAHQPESARTVAAFEVPLSTEQDRSLFLAIVSREAQAEGLHLDASSARELELIAQALPGAASSVHATVWRGAGDDHSEATITNLWVQAPSVWVLFGRGENPGLATRFRQRVMNKIMDRWPDTQTLPIMPTGAIPLPQDLRRTPDGYRVEPRAAATYRLPPSSPLIARD
jgi:hypothetical protein